VPPEAMTDRVRYRESRPLDLWGDADGYEAVLTYDRSDGWSEVFHMAAVEGRLVIAEVIVQPVGDTIPAGGVTARRLRRVQPGQAVADAYRYAGWADDATGVPVAQVGSGDDKRSGPREETRRIRARVAELAEEARRLGVRSPSKYVWEQLEREGTYRARETVRNDLWAVRRAAREAAGAAAPTARNPRAEDLADSPMIEAGARALDVTRADLGLG
jgi:hypothetical protein